MRYFISGHGWLTQEQFNEYYVPLLERILNGDPDPWFVVGDFKGVDIMAQQYLLDKGLRDKVIVFHMFDRPRNLASPDMNTIGGFKSDDARDAAMTANSDFDVAYTFRENSGTGRNIKRRHERSLD